MYIISLQSFLGAVLFYYEASKKQVKLLFNKSFSKSLFVRYDFPQKAFNIVVGVFISILILYWITYGKSIFIRSEYLIEKSRSLIILIKIFSFAEVILLGLMYHDKKWLSTIFFIILMIFSLGTGSRSVFLFFVLFTLLIFVTGKNSLFNKLRFVLHLFLSFVFLAYVMTLRQLPTHGIIPYIASIGSSSSGFGKSFMFNTYYSFIYGFFVTIKTVQKAQFDWNIIMISLNPLPGAMAGWYDYAKQMRINIYVPFSLHGRVFKMGTLFTVTFFFVLGLLFSYFEKKIRMLLLAKKRIFAFIILIMLALHIVYAFEYNMRSAIRYLYYALSVILLSYFVRQILLNLPKRKKNEG